MWKKCWLYSLSTSLSCPTLSVLSLFLRHLPSVHWLEKSLLGSFSLCALADGLLFGFIIFSFNFRTPIHPLKPSSNVTSFWLPLAPTLYFLGSEMKWNKLTQYCLILVNWLNLWVSVSWQWHWPSLAMKIRHTTSSGINGTHIGCHHVVTPDILSCNRVKLSENVTPFA